MRNLKALTVMLLLCSFMFVAACSQSGETKEPDPPKTSEQSETNPETEPQEPVAEEPPVINMNGQPIKILTWGKGPTDETQEGALQLERQNEVEKKYNTKIEWVTVPWGKSIEMVTAAGLSGEPVADIVLLDLYHAMPLIKEGLLRPIDEYFDFDDPKWPKIMKRVGNINGKMYGFKNSISEGAGIYYNKALFKREGLPDPHQLEKEGKWNWDTFLDIMKRATKDTDGDGAADQWGFTNHAPFLARHLIYANGGSIIEQRDGKWVFTSGEPKAMTALRFLGDMFNTHKVIAPNKNASMDDWNDSVSLFESGKAAMITGETWEGSNRQAMSDEFGFVAFPKGPDATDSDYKTAIENFTMYYMPSNSKQPKEAAIIWQDLILWDRVELARRSYGEEQLLADPEDVDAILEVSDHVQPLFFPGVPKVQWEEAIWSTANKGEEPESAMERILESAQASLDEALNVTN
ncbi:ABC transporter substrate-binding protein [Paenibacillus sp. GCM10027626]|uniref:ABC transporter substrate-binding protein n=1 Tax=Paenibacillus sp. GCM10027626 TaxID=3273411 RepID=UPI00363B6493